MRNIRGRVAALEKSWRFSAQLFSVYCDRHRATGELPLDDYYRSLVVKHNAMIDAMIETVPKEMSPEGSPPYIFRRKDEDDL